MRAMPTNCYRTSITRPPWKVALISTSKEKSFNAVSVIGSASYTVLSIMCSWSLTQCLHFTTGWVNTAGCTTGWVNDANESSRASLQRSIQDAYDVIRLTRSKADVWTVIDAMWRVWSKLKKNSYLFSTYFYHRQHMFLRDDKNYRPTVTDYKTVQSSSIFII